MFEKIVPGSGVKIALLACALLFCACSERPQPVAFASQPTPTKLVTPTASRTPLPVFPPTSVSPTPNASLQGAELVEALRGGGYVIYIHSGEGDKDTQTLENCNRQSSLRGQSQIKARALGISFLTLGIPIGQVLHSASCSSFELAILAFGLGENWADLSKTSISQRGERIAALRQILSTKPQPGTNNILVGHGLDITDVTGITFAEREAAIFKPLGKAGYILVTRILPSGWEQLDPKSTDLVQVEPYIDDSLPVEPVEPANRPATLSPSKRGDDNTSTERTLVLPDLTTLPPTDLRIRTSPADGHKLLRFTNSIMNNGAGRMELWGENNPIGGKMTVTQHIYDTEGFSEERVVGEFLFHPEHNHWHLGDFARYEIWSVGMDGRLDAPVAVSNKISYCLRDDARANIPGSVSRQTYIMCNHEMQGISVGWTDIYRHHLPGQSVDITFLLDGIYALRSIVNPENRLWEENSANNTAILYIEIDGNRVRVVEPREILNKPLDDQND